MSIVVKFKFDGSCFQRREASANFNVSYNMVFASPTQTQ